VFLTKEQTKFLTHEQEEYTSWL